MSSLSTKFCKIAPLKCKTKWTFGTSFASPKKGKTSRFPLRKMQASQAFSIPFFLDCVTNNTLSDTTQSSLLFIILPNQTAAKNKQQNHKKAGYFSLLLLHSFCALHFDLLFDRPDFFQSQQHEQSQNMNIVCYPTS